MHTMDQHLADLVDEGEITRDAAFEKAHDPDTLERLIRAVGCRRSRPSRSTTRPCTPPQRRDATDVDGGQELDYTSRNQSGKVVKGKLEAPSEAAALGKSAELGLSARHVAEGKAGPACNMEIRSSGFEKGVDLKSLAIMSRQLATMISSGLPLLRALHILADQTENKKLEDDPRPGGHRRRDRRVVLRLARQAPASTSRRS